MFIPYNQLSPSAGELGSGTFGTVFQGTWNGPGGRVDVAMKIFRETAMPEQYTEAQARERMQKRFKRELMVWELLRHPNILEFFGHSVTSGPTISFVMVSPLRPKGNLLEYLVKYPDWKALSARKRLNLALGVARALEYMHNYPNHGPIFHGDIKPNNVVLKDDLTPQLCDFGLARASSRVTGLTTSGEPAGTPHFEPFELWNDGICSLPGDIFSFAGLLLMLMSNQAPFHGTPAIRIGVKKLTPEIMPEPAAHPMLPAVDPLWVLMRRCWAKDPTQRPSIEVCIQELSNRYSG